MTVTRYNLSSDYAVPRIINGGWQLSEGHGRSIDSAAVVEDMFALVEAGLDTFDCADIYTGVEELIGDFLCAYKRRFGARKKSRIRVHTKYVPNLESLRDIRRGDVARSIDRSLGRLGLDCLDLVQFHWWNYSVPGYVAVAGQLAELQKQGKIRHLGVTNFDTVRLREILDAGIKVISNQVQYSLLDRRCENGMVDLCRERDLSCLCYGSLAGGFLTGRFLGMEASQWRAANRSQTKYRLIVEEFGGWALFQELVGAMSVIARKHGLSSANVAAAWVLSRQAVAAVIIGAADAARLADNLRVFNTHLDEEDELRLESVLKRAHGPGGDTFDLERVEGGIHQSIMKTNLNS